MTTQHYHAAKIRIISHSTKQIIKNLHIYLYNQSSLPSPLRPRAHGASTLAHRASNNRNSGA